jgi:endonuclease YncB( thermonuclease family)
MEDAVRHCLIAATIALFLAPCASGRAVAQTLTGTVVVVHDGDTVSVRTARGLVRVRLAGIDCPELAQRRGQDARRFTEGLVIGREVRVETRGVDQYDRVLGRLFVDGIDVNAALVRQGMAWRYERGRGDRVLAEAERSAKAAHAGLWADPAPEPPWQWRHEHEVGAGRHAGTPARRPARQTRRVALSEARGPFHGNTRSRLFHRPGCPNYNCKNCGEAFLTARSAQEAGYRPAGDCLRP